MQPNTSPLQPDSTTPADRTADADKTPDTSPEAMRALYDEIKAAYWDSRPAPDLEDPLLAGIVSAVLEGRAAQDAAGGGQ